MLDLEKIRQSVRLSRDEQGEPVIQIPQKYWEALVALIKKAEGRNERLKELFQEWLRELEEIPPLGDGSDEVPILITQPLESEKSIVKVEADPPIISTPEYSQPKPRQTRLERLIRSLFQAHLPSLVHYYLKHYKWSIIPLIVISVLLINNRMYYNTFSGYDMPQHFDNVVSIMTTGAMPLPGSDTYSYEAHQAPLFYILAAWATTIGLGLFDDSFQKFTTVLLLPVAFGWVLLLMVMVQKMLHRAHPLIRAGTLCVIALFPVNIAMMAMFGNDLPVTIFGTWAAFSMWIMVRSGRQLDLQMWLRVALLSGLAVAFKSNGLVLVGVYGALAGYIVLNYLFKRYFILARRIAIYASVGLPLMLIPWFINALHASQYPDAFSILGRPQNISDFQYWHFLVGFDTSIFNSPFELSPVPEAYWSRQYVTLHSDYFNHWYNNVSVEQSAGPFVYNEQGDVIPIEKFNTAIILQYLAIPVTAVMAFGFLYSLFRVFFRPWYAIRDGSILIVILMVVAQVAQIFLYFRYFAPSIVHARYIGFLYPFLLIVGVMWLWKFLKRRVSWQPTANRVFVNVYAAICIAYSVIAFKLMWLPAA